MNVIVGVLLVLGIDILLVILAVVQFEVIKNFLNTQQTNFQNKFITTLNNNIQNIVQSGTLGYISASQLTVNGPPGNTGSTGPVNGPIILTDPTATFGLLPYIKLTVFRTVTPPNTIPIPAVFNVLLQELELTIDTVNFNTIKFQYAKVIYIINGNPPFQYPGFANVTGVPGDSGIIKILNATTIQPSTAIVPPDEIPLSSTDPPNLGGITLTPPQVNNGVLLYPGQCKCFINAGYNQNIPPINGQTFPPVAYSTWVELTADIQPFNSVLISTDATINLRPTTKITFLDVLDGATVDLTSAVSTTVAINGQELYLVSNPPTGSVNINLFNGITNLPRGAIMALNFNGIVWTKIFPL